MSHCRNAQNHHLDDAFENFEFKDKHEEFTLPKLFNLIVQTSAFTRLYDVNQTGILYYVFNGFTTSRYVHSVGTCNLAWSMITNIALNQPHLQISRAEMLCVGVAGLLHDIGHGPLSHLFEKICREFGDDWCHEERSLEIVDELYVELKDAFNDEGIFEAEIELVKDMIAPQSVDRLRGKYAADKLYLFEIVSNKFNELDVDKFDYLRRDTAECANFAAFDCAKLIETARVGYVRADDLRPLPANFDAIDFEAGEEDYVDPIVGEFHIAYPATVEQTVFDVFRKRYQMHTEYYQAPKIVAAESGLIRAIRQTAAEEGARFNWDTKQLAKMTDHEFMAYLQQFQKIAQALALIKCKILPCCIKIGSRHNTNDQMNTNTWLNEFYAIYLAKSRLFSNNVGGDNDNTNNIVQPGLRCQFELVRVNYNYALKSLSHAQNLFFYNARRYPSTQPIVEPVTMWNFFQTALESVFPEDMSAHYFLHLVYFNDNVVDRKQYQWLMQTIQSLAEAEEERNSQEASKILNSASF